MLGRYKLLHKSISFFVLFILVISFFNIEICVAKDGNTLYVGGTSDGNYTTIQSALDNAGNNDTIYVYSGTYYEKLIIDKSINLVGSEKSSTIIDGDGDLYVIFIKSSWVNVSHFTITNGAMGIYTSDFNYSFNKITNNIFQNNSEGIRLYYSCNNKITDNVFKYHGDHGVILHSSSNNSLMTNAFIDNYKAVSFGGWSYYNIISGNNFSDNTYCINLEYSFNNFIIGNYILSNSRGITLSYSNGNNVTNNEIKENYQCGIYLINSDGNIISPNNYSHNGQNVKTDPRPSVINIPGFEFLLIFVHFYLSCSSEKNIFDEIVCFAQIINKMWYFLCIMMIICGNLLRSKRLNLSVILFYSLKYYPNL